MKHDPEHLIAVAEAQHKAYKQATRRLQHRQRLEHTTEADPEPWLTAIRHDDATDPALAKVEREREPREQVTA